MKNPFDDNLRNVFLALDPTLIRMTQDVTLIPVSADRHPANPILVRGAHGTHSEQRVGSPAVRFEDNRFRMWYSAGDGRFFQYGGGPISQYQDSLEGLWLCYAESRDGLHWERPCLGQVTFEDSTTNNIFGRGQAPAFLYDPSDPIPERRYKLAFDWWSTREEIPCGTYKAFSLDGTHWTWDFSGYEHESMECPAVFKWKGQYKMCVQAFDPLVRTPDPGGHARRVNVMYTSSDFGTWNRIPGVAFQIPRSDPCRPGFDPQTHLGIAVFPTERFCIGIYGRFIAKSSDQADTRTSLGLCISDDGHHFFEPFNQFDLVPRPRDDTAWDAHMLCQNPSSLVEVGDNWWMYYGGSRGGNVWNGISAIGIAIWRKHGLAYYTSLHESCDGVLQTWPLKVPAGVQELTVNAVVPERTSVHIRLSVDGMEYEGTVNAGDSVCLPVSWSTPVDWNTLAGKPVEYSFVIRGCPGATRLYSWEYHVKEQELQSPTNASRVTE
ncbi:hypothetical protein ACFLQR_00745 [Verrucomicrobiota bacterium]